MSRAKVVVDFYCYGANAEHEEGEFPHIYDRNNRAACEKAAVRDGWKLYGDGRGLCPLCGEANKVLLTEEQLTRLHQGLPPKQYPARVVAGGIKWKRVAEIGADYHVFANPCFLVVARDAHEALTLLVEDLGLAPGTLTNPFKQIADEEVFQLLEPTVSGDKLLRSYMCAEFALLHGPGHLAFRDGASAMRTLVSRS